MRHCSLYNKAFIREKNVPLYNAQVGRRLLSAQNDFNDKRSTNLPTNENLFLQSLGHETKSTDLSCSIRIFAVMTEVKGKNYTRGIEDIVYQ